MKPLYFLPWWPSDYIWREWTCQDDLDRKPDWHKAYLWDYMPSLVDGILVSRMAVSPRKVRGLRDEIRFKGLILGDSGAHSYRKLADPPFSCEDLLQFYADGRFDYGLTLDMVASPWVVKGGLPISELERRLKISIDNAARCLDIRTKHRYPFELLGVVQGWDEESYSRCAHELLKMGFTYLAIAGQRKIGLIKRVISNLLSLQKDVRFHILGTGNPKILEFYVENGIESFDSSTWLRKAWLSEKHNYFITENKNYTGYRATRVREKEIDLGRIDWSINIQCECDMCQKLGQQILLFRGHERNTRRGLHNIYHYVKWLNIFRNQEPKR